MSQQLAHLISARIQDSQSRPRRNVFMYIYIPYFIGYKPSDFYSSLVQIVLKSKGKRGTQLIAEILTQTEKYIDFKRRISTQVFAYKPSKTQSHKG